MLPLLLLPLLLLQLLLHVGWRHSAAVQAAHHVNRGAWLPLTTPSCAPRAIGRRGPTPWPAVRALLHQALHAGTPAVRLRLRGAVAAVAGVAPRQVGVGSVDVGVPGGAGVHGRAVGVGASLGGGGVGSVGGLRAGGADGAPTAARAQVRQVCAAGKH